MPRKVKKPINKKVEKDRIKLENKIEKSGIYKDKKFKDFKKETLENFSFSNNKIQELSTIILFTKIKPEHLKEIKTQMEKSNFSKIATDFSFYVLAKRIDPKKDVTKQIREVFRDLRVYSRYELPVYKRNEQNKRIFEKMKQENLEYIKDSI